VPTCGPGYRPSCTVLWSFDGTPYMWLAEPGAGVMEDRGGTP